MKKSVWLILLMLLFEINALNAKHRGHWEISLTAFVSHNEIFRQPTPITTFHSCYDCEYWQKYPVGDFGGGLLAERVYKSNIIFRTGIIYAREDFIEKESKETAVYYAQLQNNTANLSRYIIETRDCNKIFQVPFECGYKYKNLSAYLGIGITVIDYRNYKSISYDNAIAEDKNYPAYYPFEVLPRFELNYHFAKFKTSLLAGVEFANHSSLFYKLGIEFRLFKQDNE